MNRVQSAECRVQMRRYGCLSFIIFFLFSVLCSPFSGLSYASIEIDPMRLELELEEGKTHSGELTLVNHSDEAVQIALSADEYRYMFSPGAIYAEPPKPKTLPSCRAWIAFNPDKIELEKDAKKQVQYTIKVPSGPDDEYVAAIVIDALSQQPTFSATDTGRVKIRLTPRISLPVYVAIKKSAKRSCSISDLSAVVLEDKKTVEFSVTLKNDGTVHIRPLTRLLVLDAAGGVVDKIPLGVSLPVFAGFGEKLSAKWVPRFPGKYTVVATVDIGAGPLIQKGIPFEVKR